VATSEASLALLAALPEAGSLAESPPASLLSRARAGERDAFGDLVTPHLPLARRVALAAVGRPADADEAVQDASIAAWLHLGSLERETAFRAWFLRIVWRKALDRRRSLRAWMTRFVQDPGPGEAWWPTPVSPEPGPEELFVGTELERAAARVVRTLPRRLRDPFLLAASGDHKYDEIAALLGIPVGSVKWRVSEARKLIRLKLERLGLGGTR
jgi:RNA polymerase sigma-70 factor (ECF subfamily)